MTRANSKITPRSPKTSGAKVIALDDQSKLEPGLYITATPIGNLRDISLRALDALAAADLILCEDTRVTRKLLNAYGLSTRLQAYHDHNAAKVRPKILSQLQAGAAICLVSDAGTPLISDPGFRLLEVCLAEDIKVTSLPGASASITALTLAGLPSDRFLFLGFLPNKKAARRDLLEQVKELSCTLIVFESAKRVAKTLDELRDHFGSRPAALARELTKKFENVRRGCLTELAAHYAQAGPPKGEVVILVGPGRAAPASQSEVEAALVTALSSLSTKDAAAQVSAQTGWPRRKVYELALTLNKAARE